MLLPGSSSSQRLLHAQKRLASRRGLAGFSLIEVVLSLGIVAFVVIPLVGLTGLATDTSRNAVSTTKQTQIAQRLFSQAQARAWQMDTTTAKYKFDPLKTKLYFDFEGNPLADANASSAVFTANLEKPGDVILPPSTALPQDVAVKLTVTITSPSQPGRVTSLSTVLVRTGL